MKQIIYSLVIILLLTSCDQVIFPEPQPKKVKPLKEIPGELQGVFLDDDGDSLFVYKHFFSYRSDEFVTLKNVYLSDSAVLKKYQKRYFFNIIEWIDEEAYWLTYMLETHDQGNEIDVYTMDPGDIVKLAKLQEITSKVKDIEGAMAYYLFDPKKRDYKKIIADTIFTKMINFRRVSAWE